MPQHAANRVAIFAFTCERSVKARGKPPRRKGHGEGRGFFATESEEQAATPQRARDGGKKGKGRSCGLPRKFGPHEQLLSHLPTYRSSHPSHLLTSLLPDVSPYLLFLLLPLVLPPFPRRRPHCSTKRGREGTPLAQQDVDAKARRSLNKTFLYKDERRSLNKTLTRRHAARSTRLDDVDLDDPRLDWRWPCDL